jgi:hypothetical protein
LKENKQNFNKINEFNKKSYERYELNPYEISAKNTAVEKIKESLTEQLNKSLDDTNIE